jgi:uncharacterized membrane protein
VTTESSKGGGSAVTESLRQRNEALIQRNEAFLKRLNRLPLEPNPALLKQAQERAESVQNRVADRITDFAGSMAFVYVHILWFGLWIGLGAESYPYGLLTMIVSLEAIFLSTFVLISQNRSDAKHQVVANLQWRTVQEEDGQNVQLIDLSKQILELTQEIRKLSSGQPTSNP